MRPSRHLLALSLILIVALALRIVGGIWWQSRLAPGEKFGMPDSETYWSLARTIAQREPYQLDRENRVFRTPGYPALLAPLFIWFGPEPNPRWAFLESAMLSTLAVGAVYGLGRVLFDKQIGLVAAGLAAIYPGAISEGSLVLSEAPFVPLMIVSLTVWCIALRYPAGSIRDCISLAAGALSGAATLMRPSWLLFIPFACGVMLVVGPDRWKLMRIGLLAAAGLVFVMAPWWKRNFDTVGAFVMTTLQVGPSLYDGLHDKADGSSNMEFMRRFAGQKNSEVSIDQTLRHDAIRWAEDYPLLATLLAGKKFCRLWSPWPNEPSLRSIPLRAMVALTYVPLLALSLWSVGNYWNQGWQYALCWLPAIYFTLLHVVFVASIRYREPAMIALTPLAAVTIMNQFWPHLRGRFCNASQLSTPSPKP